MTFLNRLAWAGPPQTAVMPRGITAVRLLAAEHGSALSQVHARERHPGQLDSNATPRPSRSGATTTAFLFVS